MSDAVDLPDPEGIAEIISLKVPPLRLERDPELAGLAERLSTRRARRRFAEAVFHFLARPRDVTYDETEAWLLPKEGGRVYLLQFSFRSSEGADLYDFLLEPGEGGLKYRPVEKYKQSNQPWGGGVVPENIRSRLLPVIRKHPTVWSLSDRIVRVVEPHEIQWDWQPDWNLPNIPIPNRDGTLGDILPTENAPSFVILATWEFSLEEHEWAANGHRVQLLMDPRNDSVVEAWEDEWHVLY